MDKIIQELEKNLGQGRVRKDESMSLHTTFKIGGPAQYYIEISKLDDLEKAIKIAHTLGVPIFIFGGGSNIIVSDHGIKGLVIKNNCRSFRILQMGGTIKNKKTGISGALVYTESGTIMSQLVRFCIDNGLAGLEYQLGLPGTVGGALYMNSNFPKKAAYVGDSVYKAKIATRKGDVREVDKTYFKFAYDKSIMQETGEIVLSAIFKLTHLDKKLLWERGIDALNYRSETQPKGSSAGCTFRNISIADALRIPTPDNITSAGYLIDKAELKGRRIGDAMISPLHANFILNMGKAQAEDVVGLVKLIKDQVYNKFGVHLALEVKTVGF